MNQASFSGNWQGGGVNPIAVGTFLNGSANYAKEKWTWDNTMDFIYGVVKNKGEDGRKSNARIFLDYNVGYKLSSKWNYFRLQTNFLLKKAILLVTLVTPVDLADHICIMKFAIQNPNTF